MKIIDPEPVSGYQCSWSTLSEHPKCPHGPTLLFGRNVDGEHKQFYACSACRDRKLCSFYLEYDSKPSKQQKLAWELESKKVLPRYDHQKMYIKLNEMLAESPARRMYCHTCARLSFISEKHKHREHEVAENLTDHQLSHPTEIIKPLENPKKEAQYLFSKQSTKNIIDMLLMLGAENVLCIGAPRIHEYITNNLEAKVSSLLLDFDGRFHNFFGPLNYCWYNFFNHHFFHEDSKDVFKDFMTQNGGKNTYVVCDPPFGGRIEPMSQTLKTITDLHRKWNNITAEADGLKTLFIFPYYMEPVMREKSNPPGVSGGLKDLKMSDYKVDYDNHPLFAKSQDRKIGSQVRIFTNVDLNLLKLPESEGYKYCKRCKKWTSAENKHCKKCKECTSKDGRRYRHCNVCSRCVKPTWVHCKKCTRCSLPSHNCGETPKITGQCYKCNEFGHIEKFCTKGLETVSASSLQSSDIGELSKGRKRKSGDKIDVQVSKKKARTEKTNETTKIKKSSSGTELLNVVAAKKIKIKESVKSDMHTKKKLNSNSATKPLKKKKLGKKTAVIKTKIESNDGILETKEKSLPKLKKKSKVVESVDDKAINSKESPRALNGDFGNKNKLKNLKLNNESSLHKKNAQIRNKKTAKTRKPNKT